MTDGHHHATEFAPGSRSWKHLPRVLPYLRRYWRIEGLSILLLFVGAALSLAEPWPMAFLVDSVLTRHRAHGAVQSLFGSNMKVLVVVAALTGLALVLASNALSVVTEYVGTKLDNRLVLDFRRDVFRKAQQLPLSYHDTHRAGYFAQNINTHTTALGRIVVDIPPLLQSVLTLVGMFVIALLLDTTVAIASLMVVPFIYYSTVFYSRRVEPRLIHTRDQEGLSLSVIQEAMQMLRVILTFRREDHELRRFSDQAEYALGLRLSLTVRQTLFSLAVNVLTAVGSAVVLGLGALHVLSHRLTVGELLVMIGYIASVYRPLQTISYTMGSWQEQLVSFWLALEMLDEDPGVVEGQDAVHLERVEGRITFENVGFSYPGRPGVLQGVSCDIAPGTVVGLVGPTGAGKTTLTSLIPRLYDVTEGRVLLDGHDIRDLTLDTVRGSVAVVLQEPMLFLATIADNIRYGRLDASMDEVVAAAKAANAHDFIMALPNQYETRLGERGATLSGGERQRVCIARAFLKDAPILILDEPTSAIDSRTEGVILEALARLVAGRTTFVVAHRLSTLTSAHRILVVDDGRVVEDGTHADLVGTEAGLYRRLWDAQTGRATPASPPETLPVPAPAEAQVSPEPVRPTAAAAPAASTEAGGRRAAPSRAKRPKAVVLGLMSRMPVAGVVWQTVHYLLGLERIGFEAYYVEAHAGTPSMLMSDPGDDSSELAARFISGALTPFGLGQRWAFHALHDDGRCLGMSRARLTRLYRDAAVIFNLHGGTEPRPEHYATGRLVYVETDPCQLQVELAEERQRTLDFLEPHCAFFTFGENIGRDDCLLPVSDRFVFHPTRQPVLVDLWQGEPTADAAAFTTIGNWHQPHRPVVLNGETYHWSKDREFQRFLTLPEATGSRFELALSSLNRNDKRMLAKHGWGIRDALEISADPTRYQDFIRSSRGEFTVAKDQNVRLRSGWFSDRSATYLAAGRPVVTQDTGFGSILPTGAGLFAFSDLEEAADAVRRIEADYASHCRAAAEVARGHFSAETVLAEMVGRLGLSAGPAAPRRAVTGSETDPVLTPVSRRPLRLADATTEAVLARPVPAHPVPEGRARARLAVVTRDNLVCLRLCLESVLADQAGGPVEVVVVDNASSDGTASYLEALSASNPGVRVIRNPENRGFAAGVNQGLSGARADFLVVMNDDTIVPPGWLDRLLPHLSDAGVGAVGPVTGRSGTASEIEVGYHRLSEFLAEAVGLSTTRSGQVTQVPMLAMFCLAIRRGTFERIGPLDESFGLGLFEDDDYAERLRRAGYRLLCAEDTLVHHFGEASFGDLVPTGHYGELFEANRCRFEEKWGIAWQPHRRRTDPGYAEAVTRIQETVARVLPPDAAALVVSKGDSDLLELGRPARHFPSTGDGSYSGHHPADSGEVIAMLKEQAAGGATHLVVPSFSGWWLEHYRDLDDRLRRHGQVLADDPDVTVFQLPATWRLDSGLASEESLSVSGTVA